MPFRGVVREIKTKPQIIRDLRLFSVHLKSRFVEVGEGLRNGGEIEDGIRRREYEGRRVVNRDLVKLVVFITIIIQL